MDQIIPYEPFDEQSFEANCKENSFTYWWGNDLMRFLEYENYNTFTKAINKAMVTCNALNIPIIENFIQVQRIVDGRNLMDFKLSRFACYLTVMNGDPKKKSVAKAQAYFAGLAGAVHNYLQEAEKVERLQVREEISVREKSLSGVAFQSGVKEYGLFQNAGYRGMYNKNINDLRTLRGINAGKSLLDYMGRDELAANLFRITQTELKIKNEGIRGQAPLETAAFNVGRKVRQTMIDISQVAPENLPKHEDIKVVKKDLKNKRKELKKFDQKKLKKK